MTSTSAATIIRMPRAARLTIEGELHAADEQQEGGDHRERHRDCEKLSIHASDFTKT